MLRFPLSAQVAAWDSARAERQATAIAERDTSYSFIVGIRTDCSPYRPVRLIRPWLVAANMVPLYSVSMGIIAEYVHSRQPQLPEFLFLQLKTFIRRMLTHGDGFMTLYASSISKPILGGEPTGRGRALSALLTAFIAAMFCM
jgi:hypothetical protein